MGNLLKIIIISCCSILLAQGNAIRGSGIIFGGGMNVLRYNSEPNFETSWRFGLHVGFEVKINQVHMGLSMARRGGYQGEIFEMEDGSYLVDSAHVNYDYLDLHLIYPVQYGFFRYFSGIKVGIPQAGERTFYLNTADYYFDEGADEETFEIKANEMETDFGLLFGFLMGRNLRITYYHGIPNIRKSSSESSNNRNSVLELSFVYPISGHAYKIL